MLQVVALTYNELAPVLPIGRCLPPEGGTIGRDSDNAVVLPDPMRLVSRRHLQVARESDGSYWLANISESNPALVNDSSLEPGSRRPLVVGDEVRVIGTKGDYYYVLLGDGSVGCLSTSEAN